MLSLALVIEYFREFVFVSSNDFKMDQYFQNYS